jgi:hypothetical protein
MGAEIEVEAGHRRLLHRVPTPSRRGDHRESGCRHPRLLRAGDDEVDAPGVHLERNRAQPRDAVDEDQRVRGDVVDRRGEIGDGVHHAC